MKDYKQIKSKTKGPIITIMGGIHGDEICGYKAVEHFMKNITTINKGTLNLVIANQLAITHDKREVNYNMNRIFRDNLPEQIKDTYEYKRSLEIKETLDQSDILIDLHSSVEGSQPFIICEENGLEIASCVNVKNILINIDAFHPGSTDGYMNNKSKIGICIECGYKKDPESTNFAISAVESILVKLGVIDSDLKINRYTQDVFRSEYIYTAKSNEFVIPEAYTDFDIVKAGDIVAMDGEASVRFKKHYHILFANHKAKKGDEAFLLVEKQN